MSLRADRLIPGVLFFLVGCTSFVHGNPTFHYLPVVGSALAFGFFLICVGLVSSLAFSTTRKASAI